MITSVDYPGSHPRGPLSGTINSNPAAARQPQAAAARAGCELLINVLIKNIKFITVTGRMIE